MNITSAACEEEGKEERLKMTQAIWKFIKIEKKKKLFNKFEQKKEEKKIT